MRIIGWLLAAVALFPLAFPADAAEEYPARPIRIVVPSGAGGITDILARVIAQKLHESIGQPVIVDNKSGASGIAGSEFVANAKPDGYTLLMVFPTHPVNPSLFSSMPYDTVKAFAPITMVSRVAPVLLVSRDFPAKSVQELIAMAKEKPGQLNYASVGLGSMGQLASELFCNMTGTQITHIPYKGSPQALTAVISGEVQMYMIGSAGTAAAQDAAGRVRALGVSTKLRIPALPHVPPIGDTLPGYEASGWNGILAPAGTPKEIIERLNREIVKIVRSPEFGKHLVDEGATAVGNSPEEFDAIIRADIRKWAEVIKGGGPQKN
jgi:tripartite-type tricarboxylate transporter receptor subunit TctC